jgi:hypothetical protein
LETGLANIRVFLGIGEIAVSLAHLV